jgi:hypothetical protein
MPFPLQGLFVPLMFEIREAGQITIDMKKQVGIRKKNRKLSLSTSAMMLASHHRSICFKELPVNLGSFSEMAESIDENDDSNNEQES